MALKLKATDAKNLPKLGARASQSLRTKMCRFYPRNCAQGSACKFAHHEDDLQKPKKHDKPSVTVCKHWERGACRFGQGCAFRHVSASAYHAEPAYLRPFSDGLYVIQGVTIINTMELGRPSETGSESSPWWILEGVQCGSASIEDSQSSLSSGSNVTPWSAPMSYYA
eukprot:TRINITY_DN52653_c0_g2_i1.p1 TRINITY_DN52653_c0_g2~~TRINITY_DN52653_c0_g2_i1.p1  ORF type:complete len:168 (-),score=11.63 TRINITY_DN52653_c0_g2_i1:203-706(-)